MDALKFVEACQEQSPIDLYDVALGVFTTDLPEELFENYDVMMTIELLANTLYEDKEFEKARQLVEVLQCHQPELYQECSFSLLPPLITYSLFKGEKEKAEYYMKELAIAPEEDFLLFVHMLDLIDAYGYIDMMDRIVTGVLNSDNHLDDEDHEILESYIMPVESQTEYDSLKEIREDFLDIAEELNLSAVTAENIVDALIDYFERNLSEGVTDKIILEEKSFRNYIIGLLDIEYMDTYEYAAMVLWGSVYLIDLMKKRGQMTAEDADKSLEIIRKIKAFIMINIPWDGYWKLKFIHDWVRPLSVTEEEFNSERKLCLNNFAIKPDEIINHSIKDLFNDYMNDISYARYLESEQNLFEEMIAEEDKDDFGSDRKKDSMFPYFNYLSGETEDELKAMPSGYCDSKDAKKSNDCCSSKQ